MAAIVGQSAGVWARRAARWPFGGRSGLTVLLSLSIVGFAAICSLECASVAGGELGGQPGDHRIDLIHAVTPSGGVQPQIIDIGRGQLAYGHIHECRWDAVAGVVDQPGVGPAIGR